MSGLGKALGAVFGVVAAVLFVLAFSVDFGYLPVVYTYGQTTAELGVYGILATIVAVGAVKALGTD